MNTILPKYILLSLLLTIVVACSNIDEGDRYIDVPAANVARHVLIEDFTGQRCVNCPDATSLIHTMQQAYGEENLITVALYSGPFGQTTSGRLYDLTTETGNYYFNQLGVDSQPVARINRHAANLVTSSWYSEVYEYIQEEPTLDLSITNAYDSSSRQVDISVVGTALADVDGQLQVWLTENGILDFQYQSDGDIEDEYVHNNVFRTTVNDCDGDAYSLSSGQSTIRDFSVTLDEAWVADSMAVVAFVFTAGDVLQVTSAPVVAKTQTDE